MSKKCVKCGYIRQATDTAPDYECPKCGVIYAKAEAALAAPDRSASKQVGTNVEPVANKKLKIPTKWVVLFMVVISAIGLVGNRFYKQHKEQVKKQEEADRVAQIALEIEKNKKLMQSAAKDFLIAVMKGSMKDPDSLQLKSVQEYTQVMKHNSGIENVLTYKICGEVNAKNSYGGYVGYRPFYAYALLENGKLDEKNTYFKIRDPDGIYDSSFFKSMAEECKNDVILSGK